MKLSVARVTLLCICACLLACQVSLAQLVTSGAFNASLVTVQPPESCTCQPCGCSPDGSCAGSTGCAPVPPSEGYYGGATPPSKQQPFKRFDGKTVLITGGSYGIGFGISKAFVEECATVVFCARNKERGLEAQKYLRSIDTSGCKVPPKPAKYYQADVRSIASVRSFIKPAGDFDIAVNNAAVGGYGIRRLVDIDDKYLSADFPFDAIAVNVYGMLYSMKVELEHWEAQCKADSSKCSRVMVVVGSIAGITSSPNNAVYAASKAAVNSLCKSVAMEYKPPVQGVFPGDGPLNVRINCVAPGPVNTPLLRNFAKSFPQYGNLYPWQCWKKAANGTLVKSEGGVTAPKACPDIQLGEDINVQAFAAGQSLKKTRMGEAEEEAAIVLNLASDAASYVRGAIYTVDGGFTAY